MILFKTLSNGSVQLQDVKKWVIFTQGLRRWKWMLGVRRLWLQDTPIGTRYSKHCGELDWKPSFGPHRMSFLTLMPVPPMEASELTILASSSVSFYFFFFFTSFLFWMINSSMRLLYFFFCFFIKGIVTCPLTKVKWRVQVLPVLYSFDFYSGMKSCFLNFWSQDSILMVIYFCFCPSKRLRRG